MGVCYPCLWCLQDLKPQRSLRVPLSSVNALALVLPFQFSRLVETHNIDLGRGFLVSEPTMRFKSPIGDL